MKLDELLKQGIKILEENNIDESKLNAKVLLSHILNLKKEELIIYFNKEIKEDDIKEFLTRNP